LIVDFFIKIFPTAETFSPDMLESVGAALPFVEQVAAPQEMNASLGVTVFYPKNMVNRHTILKFGVS